MRVFTSPYTLKLKSDFSGVHKSSEGVLIKLIDEYSVEKYSLYHPIESLGDLSLQGFYKNQNLREKLLGKIKKCFISEKEKTAGVVTSYCLCSSQKELFEKTDQFLNSGFKLIKLKAHRLSDLDFALLKETPFTYILDFNGQEEVKSFKCLDALSQSFLSGRVKYVEDPYKNLEKLNFSLAGDFIDYGLLADYKVVKPTAFDQFAPSQTPIDFADKLVVTSYLDHPLGQLLSAKWAIEQGVQQECGLWTHVLYEPNKFSELLGTRGRLDLSVADDFLHLLNKEKWTEV